MASERINEVSVIDRIIQLKKERNAVILAHNYQIPEIQDFADFVGDSLGLSQAAAKTDANIIVFCGVHFMAETASILCPNKKVLIPDLDAGCSLAATINGDDLRAWKRKHPDAEAIAYVNTSAEIKAESDYCCTSTNALEVIDAIPTEREILFAPDMFLGAYISAKTGRKLHIWPGECHVHAGIRPDDIMKLRNQHPDAEFLIHPECSCATSCMYYLAKNDILSHTSHILSTEGMIRRAKESPAKEFVVATETGILHRLRKENPGKVFYPVSESAVCKYMKMITPEKVLNSLENMVYEVKVPENIATKARVAIQRMMQLV